MDGLTLSTTTTAKSLFAVQFVSQPFFHAYNKSRILTFPYRKPRNLAIFASREDSEFDGWDITYVEFGKMIGEDPSFTLQKIKYKKLYPELSFLDIEKLLKDKKKRKSITDIEEIFPLSDVKSSTKSAQGLPVPKKGTEFEVNSSAESAPGFNLVRPVPKKGIEFEVNSSAESAPGLNLVRPVPKKGIKFEVSNKPEETNTKSSNRTVTKETKSKVPDVTLRKKPSIFTEDGGDTGMSSLFTMEPNLSVKMREDSPCDIALLKKPAPMRISPEENADSDSSVGTASAGKRNAAMPLRNPELVDRNFNEGKQESSKEQPESDSGMGKDSSAGKSNAAMPLRKPELVDCNFNEGKQESFMGQPESDSGMDKGSATELQADTSHGASGSSSMDTLLIGSPKRLDHSNATNQELERNVSSIKDSDWKRAEMLLQSGERVEVELIRSNTRGFDASFGSLIGFIPYRNVGTRWKFLAFKTWLKTKGLDPSMYRQNLGIISNYEVPSMLNTSETTLEPETVSNTDRPVTSDMTLEDLLMIYDQEKNIFLSSLVGQKIYVDVAFVDRSSQKLLFSIKPKQRHEAVEKKRSLMKQLCVGDIVKCCITKIMYFGIFVEIEGVPALIHQTEVAWDSRSDPASYFKVGQIIEAKVHQLDFTLERIFLSLKEITPDPLSGGLDELFGDHETAQADTEWPEVDSLIKELQQFEGIKSVSKGRYFLSPGLAPTFQVYMASMFEKQYKLLARAGNRVQEVIVKTELGKEGIKNAILTCTNRVQ